MHYKKKTLLRNFVVKSICECGERNFNRKKIGAAFAGDVKWHLSDEWDGDDGWETVDRAARRRLLQVSSCKIIVEIITFEQAPKRSHFDGELFPFFATSYRPCSRRTISTIIDARKQFTDPSTPSPLVIQHFNRNRNFPHFSLSWLNNHFLLPNCTVGRFGIRRSRTIAQTGIIFGIIKLDPTVHKSIFATKFHILPTFSLVSLYIHHYDPRRNTIQITSSSIHTLNRSNDGRWEVENFSFLRKSLLNRAQRRSFTSDTDSSSLSDVSRRTFCGDSL